ncbi:hypothetical protein COU20_03295 [Candidatus Kaiserbacteria bacterium CG10_big_fil_rev_8_21_14_0_10_59_10]|uniref:Uncharacterized protein n=1 Tax=Candidatus Kaiserbacteria bacterium CG10_big_fil_rev_8_21_14_0_10_59_10 TaxID=1974612 RepID=A0A2H0U6V9_9BACT|nr:MAG: hypothetical protein COU20_03295 [Candidatus Kaiserbacteria bacterium CG10_big_fil_rev_8_21_14_0_10_59_10]
MPDRIVPCDGLNCNVCHLAELAQNVLNTGIFIIVFLSALLFAYAGWLYLTNVTLGGAQKAKSIFTNVAIGLIVVLVGWLVVDTIMRVMLGENGGAFGPWNSICAVRTDAAGRVLGGI